VLCPETANGGLQSLADGLVQTLSGRQIKASVGFAQRAPSDSSPDDMVARADAALYKRKRDSASRVGALATA
jgi:PleD family two-component response regulator